MSLFRFGFRRLEEDEEGNKEVDDRNPGSQEVEEENPRVKKKQPKTEHEGKRKMIGRGFRKEWVSYKYVTILARK